MLLASRILRIRERGEGGECRAAESAQTSCSRHCELSGKAAHAGRRGGRAQRHFAGNFFLIQRILIRHVHNEEPFKTTPVGRKRITAAPDVTF